MSAQRRTVAFMVRLSGPGNRGSNSARLDAGLREVDEVDEPALAARAGLELRIKSNWAGSFFNWSDDDSQSNWGDGRSAQPYETLVVTCRPW